MQACAIVGGHVLRHHLRAEKAVALLPPNRAIRGQLPLLVVMIGYTCAGLLLLFSPERRLKFRPMQTFRGDEEVRVPPDDHRR